MNADASVMIGNLTAGLILAWILGAFFIVGGLVNGIAPRNTRADYLRWGYPAWFHYVAAILEPATAGLLFFPVTRVAGAALGAADMSAAIATVVRNREYAHAIAPAIVLVLTILAGWMAFAAA
jgi:hypothetical protein